MNSLSLLNVKNKSQLIDKDQYKVERNQKDGIGIRLTLNIPPESNLPTELLSEKLKEGQNAIEGTPIIWGKPQVIEDKALTNSAEPETTVVFFPIMQISSQKDCFFIKRVAFQSLERSIENGLGRYKQILRRAEQRIRDSNIDVVSEIELVLEFQFKFGKAI